MRKFLAALLTVLVAVYAADAARSYVSSPGLTENLASSSGPKNSNAAEGHGSYADARKNFPSSLSCVDKTDDLLRIQWDSFYNDKVATVCMFNILDGLKPDETLQILRNMGFEVKEFKLPGFAYGFSASYKCSIFRGCRYPVYGFSSVIPRVMGAINTITFGYSSDDQLTYLSASTSIT